MENRTINLYANNQTLVIDKVIEIVSDTENYIYANVDLGENWQSFDSVRVIWSHGVDVSMVLNDGICKVPADVIADMGVVKVNLVGSNVENDVLVDRLTTEQIPAILVKQNVPIDGTDPQEVTPSQFEQFVEAVKDDADRAEQSASEAETSAQNASDSATSAHNSAESAHDDKIAIEQAIAEVIQQIEDFEQVQVVVNTLPPSSQATSDFTDGVLTLGIPQGVKGDTGNGIQSITKTGTSGLVDTYTITFTDGQTTTFNVTNGAKGDTGNGIASIEKTSTVGLVDTYTITYTNGNTTTFTVTNGEKGDKGDTGEVSLSELEQATVVQTLSDNEPYNYRRTNNGNGAGVREYDEIVGASVGWNQLVNTTDTSVTIQSGHKYYSNINNVKTIGLSNGTAISINDGTKDNIIDLTLFNSAIADYVYSLEQSTAGSGVTWLKSHFPKLFDNGYQPYDSGSIKSVSGLTAHEMVGVNQWDEEWEVGGLASGGGVDQTLTARRTTSFISILPNTSYYVPTPCLNGRYAYYDANKNLITYNGSGFNTYINTTPSGAYYMRVTLASAYGTTYNHDICINLSDTSINGQYEPHEKHTYPLDSSVTLRGQYKLDANNQLYADGDVYASDGSVTRKYGEAQITADLITMNTAQYSNVAFADIHVPTGGMQEYSKNAMLEKFGSAVTHSGTWDSASHIGRFYNDATKAGYWVGYPAGTTLEQMQADLVGLTMVYELATPTTETATPYTSPQWCDSHGTEEYVGSELPVGHNTDYPMSLSDTVPTASGNYTLKCTVTNGKPTFTWQSV